MAPDIKFDSWSLPVSFYFMIEFPGEPFIGSVSFQEVSGLSVEMSLEKVSEGGVNDYAHSLPQNVTHGNLVFKRAIMSKDSNLITWVIDTLSYGFVKPIKPRSILVTLLRERGVPLCQWLCARAYPVKWDIDSFESQKNSVAVETLEFTYTSLTRML